MASGEKNYLLYQAYGKKEIAEEAIFSILSYLRTNPEDSSTTVVIYTDSEDLFKKVFGEQDRILYRIMDEATLQDWRGEIDFVHRVKIRIIQDFFSRHEGKLLYVDSDTCFINEVSAVFDAIGRGELYMHCCEGKIDSRRNPIFRKLYRFLKKEKFEDANGKFQIPLSTAMWNAGVIGLHSRDQAILPQVLSLTDQLYSAYPKHIMEQLAFSWCIQQKGPVMPAESYIYHYWDFKAFRTHIHSFLEARNGATLSALVQASGTLLPWKEKKEIEPKPFWKRMLRLK